MGAMTITDAKQYLLNQVFLVRLPVRLMNGQREVTSSGRGYVQVFHDGRWGSICSNSWGDKDAKVVCRMLNIS